jgi:hypothetical protein
MRENPQEHPHEIWQGALKLAKDASDKRNVVAKPRVACAQFRINVRAIDMKMARSLGSMFVRST